MHLGLFRPFFALVLGSGCLAFFSLPTETEDRTLSPPGPLWPDPGVHASSPPSPSPRTDPEIQALQAELEGILTSTGNRSGSWGVLAVSLDRGDTLLSLNHQEPLVPASNQKLLTTAAALYTLGPEFRFSTFLLTRGRRVEGVLEGDLILFGTGDPTLSDRYYPGEMAALDTLAQRVFDSGIREIRGDLVVDGSYFLGPDLHPEWDPADLNDPFAAPVPAVTFNENVVTVRVEARGQSGPRPSIYTMPEGSGIPVINAAVTTPRGTRSRIWLFRDTPWDPIGIEGEIPVGGRDVWRRLPVPDPLVFTGRELKIALENRGIRMAGNVRVNRNPAASLLPTQPTLATRSEPSSEILTVLESPPLLEILRVVNKESHNLFAEAVGKTLGRMVTGEGSFGGTEEAVTRFLTRDVGIPAEELRVRDGSGLSPENRVSAGAIIRLLDFMAASPLWDDFWSTLPEAGVRRELGRMGGTPASRNLRAKTGTMEGVSALSGMVRTRSGERVLFSILSNDVASEIRAKRAEDQVGIRLANLSRPQVDPSPLR
jgi:D-alanyl-D-alanine carboxypeptidase/D-alanyl-D-alanine-endopeptidase (penicillin-binding protein 4)